MSWPRSSQSFQTSASSWSTTAHVTGLRSRPSGREPLFYGCPSTSGSAGPCRPATCTHGITCYDVAIQIDGDGQHVAGEVEKLLEPLREGRADLVVGTRWRGEGDNRTSPARRVGTVMFARLVSLIVRQRVTDTTSGFRAVNRDGILLFSVEYPHDYPEVETTALAFRHGLRMLEVPVTMRDRASGESSITLIRSVYYVVKVTLALFVGMFRKPVDIPEDV